LERQRYEGKLCCEETGTELAANSNKHILHLNIYSIYCTIHLFYFKKGLFMIIVYFVNLIYIDEKQIYNSKLSIYINANPFFIYK